MAFSVTRPTGILDLDSCNVYRVVNTQRDANGDYTAGYVLTHSGYAVNHHGTHNFDERIERFPAILKKQNIMTADVITCSISLEFQPEDIIYLTTRDGRNMWLKVCGEDDARPLTGYTTFYLTPNVAPKVHS